MIEIPKLSWYAIIAILVVCAIALFLILGYTGIIDTSNLPPYEDIATKYVKYNPSKYSANYSDYYGEMARKYNYSNWVAVNKTVTEEEKPSIFNNICDLLYLGNITNTTMGSITCFKPEPFNITAPYDCICYY